MPKIFLSAAVLGLSFLPSAAHAGAVLSIGSVSVASGGSVLVPVQITGVNNLFAYQFDFTFLPSLASAGAVTEGPFLGGGGSTFFLSGTVDNAAGVVTGILDTLIGPFPGVSGSGVLAQIPLTGLSPGFSPMSLSNAVVLDADLADIPFTTADGTLTVTGTNSIPEPSSRSQALAGAVMIVCVGFAKRRSHSRMCSARWRLQ